MNDIDNARFAGDILLPWSEVKRKPGDPLWVNRDQATYEKASKLLRGYIVNELNDNKSIDSLAKRLVKNSGYSFDEARETVSEIDEAISKGRRPRSLRQLRFNVANADADEQLSKRALQLSNFDPVDKANKDHMFATDLSATLNGTPVNIDAQSRTGRIMGLGVVQGGLEGVQDAFTQDGLRLIDAIDMLREQEWGNNFNNHMNARHWRGFEDKLLQTTDDRYNRVPSAVFRDNPEIYAKDMLISSARPGDSQQRYGHGGTKNAPPYNRTLPKHWDMIDLDVIREDLLNKTYSQLQDKDIDIFDTERGDSIKLALPPSYIKTLKDRNMANVSDEVNERFVNKNYELRRR